MVSQVVSTNTTEPYEQEVIDWTESSEEDEDQSELLSKYLQQITIGYNIFWFHSYDVDVSLFGASDQSSVDPQNPIFRNTTYEEQLTQHTEVIDALEHNIVVRIPPKKIYTIELKVNSIRKAQPNIVDPF